MFAERRENILRILVILAISLSRLSSSLFATGELRDYINRASLCYVILRPPKYNIYTRSRFAACLMSDAAARPYPSQRTFAIFREMRSRRVKKSNEKFCSWPKCISGRFAAFNPHFPQQSRTRRARTGLHHHARKPRRTRLVPVARIVNVITTRPGKPRRRAGAPRKYSQVDLVSDNFPRSIHFSARRRRRLLMRRVPELCVARDALMSLQRQIRRNRIFRSF